jgi:hypothetical protein
MKLVASLALCALAIFTLSSSAADSPAKSVRQTLSAVPMAELPAKAADIVRNAKVRDRGFVTVDVVEAALAINPNAAPTVVAAIAKAVPDMASIAAGKAAELRPNRAAEIGRAAAAAAPSKAAKIAAAVSRAAPAEYRNVAVAVAHAAPGNGAQILRAIASVFPELKPAIDGALAANLKTTPTVASVLDSAKPVTVTDSGAVAADGTPPVRGPAVAPPYVPGSGSGPNVTTSTSGTVPRGGRNYATP